MECAKVVDSWCAELSDGQSWQDDWIQGVLKAFPGS